MIDLEILRIFSKTKDEQPTASGEWSHFINRSSIVFYYHFDWNYGLAKN